MTAPLEGVRQVRQHRQSLAWWFRASAAFPGGLVPLPTAARMLGVSPRRVRALVDEGRIRLIDGMPGGSDRDRFVPVVDLIDGPFVLDRGQPGVWGPENRFSQDFLDRNPQRSKRRSDKGLRNSPHEFRPPGPKRPGKPRKRT